MHLVVGSPNHCQLCTERHADSVQAISVTRGDDMKNVDSLLTQPVEDMRAVGIDSEEGEL